MGQPIFVLGKQRSGTTWLANQLSQHSQIAAVRDDHHGGIHESAYFSHVAGRYGDLSHKTNYVEFAEVMAASDTLRILGVGKKFLYSLWPTTYEGVFTALMNEAARKKSARYWLDKTPEHTLMIDRLAATYPDAKFVATVRDPYEVMGSNIGRYSGKGWRRRVALFRGTLNLVHHIKEIDRSARRSERVRVVPFTELRRNPEEAFRELMDFLELEFEPDLLAEAYPPNTTFRGTRADQRSKTLTPSDKRLIGSALRVGELLPTWGYRAARQLTHQSSKAPLPKWFFSMYSPGFKAQPGGHTVAERGYPGGLPREALEHGGVPAGGRAGTGKGTSAV